MVIVCIAGRKAKRLSVIANAIVIIPKVHIPKKSMRSNSAILYRIVLLKGQSILVAGVRLNTTRSHPIVTRNALAGNVIVKRATVNLVNLGYLGNYIKHIPPSVNHGRSTAD